LTEADAGGARSAAAKVRWVRLRRIQGKVGCGAGLANWSYTIFVEIASNGFRWSWADGANGRSKFVTCITIATSSEKVPALWRRRRRRW
jgi:hypothetical protein